MRVSDHKYMTNFLSQSINLLHLGQQHRMKKAKRERERELIIDKVIITITHIDNIRELSIVRLFMNIINRKLQKVSKYS